VVRERIGPIPSELELAKRPARQILLSFRAV